MTDYEKFLVDKTQAAGGFGFEPLVMPKCLFPFQQALVEWALILGRAAIIGAWGLNWQHCSVVGYFEI